MSQKYPNLLSPFKIGNVVLKNRMTSAPAQPHFIQGSEPYPTEAINTYYANIARNGAAVVTFAGVHQFISQKVPIVTEKYFEFDGHGHARHRVASALGMPYLADNLESQLAQLTSAIHFYGSKASICLFVNQNDLGTAFTPFGMGGGKPGGMGPGDREEITEELMNKIADEYVLHSAFAKDMGFDMVMFGMQEQFLSTATNKRTDKFGGSWENRARFPIMIADRIKQKCGQDFLVNIMLAVHFDPYPGGITLEETVRYAKLFEGHIDMLEIRPGHSDPKHPTNFMPERTPFLYMTEAIKKSGAKIAVVTNGGYVDLGLCENAIASGKADFISMARSWISNPEYGKLAYEGRGEDVVPCLRCNKCHIPSQVDAWASVCSVNPTWGFEHKIDRMIDTPTTKKRVAVIGGGVAGMEAALVATKRGHEVTLYEKSDSLGGTLKISDYPSFKWPQKAFKNYLISQIKKHNIKVQLNTEATSGMLKKEKFDAVFAAVGAEPVVPDIPGIKGKNVQFARDVYGSESSLADNVVVVGGGETGVEVGMHLAEKGHKVTVLEMGDMLAPKTTTVHFYSIFKSAWEKLENFKSILNARCTGIGADNVIYVDAEGAKHTIAAGSVVIAVGMKSKNDQALAFYGAADRFFIIGDCEKVGNIQKTMRSAFSNASMI